MKADLREIYSAPDRAVAGKAITVFAEKYGAKYAKAVECLTKDRETLLAFFDFPAEHWDHLRTSNPIESVFATCDTGRCVPGARCRPGRHGSCIQARHRSIQDVAPPGGREPVPQGRRWCQVPDGTEVIDGQSTRAA